jgi:8-oxo-dGTP pyrophosphatase MutT (NUDIX family)
MAPFCKGITSGEAYQVLGGSILPEESLAHWVAGIRELFEEAGVLLAYDQTGNPFLQKNPSEAKRFLNYRDLLQKGELTIWQLAKEEKVFLALDQLHYFAHWITPEARSERFDTRFFVARFPVGQEATYDQKETTLGLWLPPKEALEQNLKGEMVLSPPTLKTLEDLSRFKDLDEVFNSLKNREVRTVLPVLTKISGAPSLIFPWDLEYPLFQRGEIPAPVNHGNPSLPGDNTTRLILKEDRWLPFCRRPK